MKKIYDKLRTIRATIISDVVNSTNVNDVLKGEGLTKLAELMVQLTDENITEDEAKRIVMER